MRTLAELAREDYCYLSTRGRVTGRTHTIEIWFALRGSTLYLLSGGGRRSDWVRNIQAHPEVQVRLGGHEMAATGRLVDEGPTDEDREGGGGGREGGEGGGRAGGDEGSRARRLLYEKYRSRYGGSLESWRDRALVVALDLEPGAGA